MTARTYLEVVLFGLALLALPRAARFSVALTRRAVRRRDRRWLALLGLGGVLVLASMALTVLHRNRGIGTLALTEDPKSVGLLCALAFAGGIVLRTSWWAVMSVFAWAIAVALSQVWMVGQLGTAAYAGRLQDYITPTWDRFDGRDVVGLTVIGSAPIALSATAGVLAGRVFWSRGTCRSQALATSTLVIMTLLVVITLQSVNFHGEIQAETDHDARLWYLSLAMASIAAAVLRSWWSILVIPLLSHAATLTKSALTIQSEGIAAFRRDLPCRFMAIFDPYTLEGVVLMPLIWTLVVALPLALGGRLIGKTIRFGWKRKRLRMQNALSGSDHSTQPESDGS